MHFFDNWYSLKSGSSTHGFWIQMELVGVAWYTFERISHSSFHRLDTMIVYLTLRGDKVRLREWLSWLEFDRVKWLVVLSGISFKSLALAKAT